MSNPPYRSNQVLILAMSDSALFPLPGVCYRLQSVGLVSYLDLYDIYDNKIITRPLHDGKEQQVRNIYMEVTSTYYVLILLR